jgi:serine/threonine-protein kinase RsbW
LVFTVSDEGNGFDVNSIPDPTAPENIENLSGRGIFIIKKLADQCIFNTIGNELELHFKI